MRFTFIFNLVLAASFLSDIRSRSGNFLNNAASQTSQMYGNVLSQVGSLRKFILSKLKKHPGKQALLDEENNNENEKEKEKRMREFFEKITKQLEEARLRRQSNSPGEENSNISEISDSTEKKEL